MELNLDSASIDIPCPQCGKASKQLFGRLRLQQHEIACECGCRFSLNTAQLDELHARLQQISRDALGSIRRPG